MGEKCDIYGGKQGNRNAWKVTVGKPEESSRHR